MFQGAWLPRVGFSYGSGGWTLAGNLIVSGDLTVNGTTTTIHTTNLLIEDKFIVLNVGGTTAGAVGAGVGIEGDAAAVVGYFRTPAADNTSYELKAPGTAWVMNIKPGATAVFEFDGALHVEAASHINQDLSTDSATAQFGTLTLNNSGLHVLDTNASHDLIITPGSDLTADRILTLTTGDAARTLSIEADSIINQDLSSDSTVPAFGRLSLTSTGAASTASMLMNGVIYAAGTGTTNFPHLLIQPTSATASTTWSTGGTAIGINLDLAAGNFVDFCQDGTSKFLVANSGSVTCVNLTATVSANATKFTVTSGGPSISDYSLGTPSTGTGAPNENDVIVLNIGADNKGKKGITTDTTIPVIGTYGALSYTYTKGKSTVNCDAAIVSRGDTLIVSTAADGCAMAGASGAEGRAVGYALTAKAAQTVRTYASHTTANPGVMKLTVDEAWSNDQRVVLMDDGVAHGAATAGGLISGQAYFVRNHTHDGGVFTFELSLTAGGASLAMTAAAKTGTLTVHPTGTVSIWIK